MVCEGNVHNIFLVVESRSGRWVFEKLMWKRFVEESDAYVRWIQEQRDIESYGNEMVESIRRAAMISIPKSKGRLERKAVHGGTINERSSQEQELSIQNIIENS